MAPQHSTTEPPVGHAAPHRSSPAGWVAAAVMLAVFVAACLFLSRYDPPALPQDAAAGPPHEPTEPVSAQPLYVPFDEPGDLAGRPAGNGERWVVHAGSFRSDGAVLAAAPSSVATLDTGTAGSQVSAVLPAGGARSAAVVANADATGTRFVAATLAGTGDVVRLMYVDGAVSTELAKVRVEEPTTLGLRFTGLSWVVTVDGGEVLSHPVASAELEALGANTRFGVYAPPAASPSSGVRFVALELQ